MNKVIGIPSDGPELSDNISEHFGHANYFVGIEIDENNNYKKLFSLRNEGHAGCMEPVMNMKNRRVTDMIIGGIGGRPYKGFLQVGINLHQGIYGTLKDNVEYLLGGRLIPLAGASCGENSPHQHEYS
ncbi:MAG: NifB/NifX family molybdenum-iron cluster-binding protein [Promethearchaeota archaeon]